MASTRASILRLALSFLAATVILAHCTSTRTPDWPELGSQGQPHSIVVDELEAVPGETHLDPHADNRLQRPQFFEQGELEPGLLMQHYPNLTLGGPHESAGTSVFFAADEDRFYLLEDHMMGHFDEPIGPFRGDPRVVLVLAVHPESP